MAERAHGAARVSEAVAVAEALGLQPHPEGGWYRETWRHAPVDGAQCAGTAIYYLLAGGAPSRWHRLHGRDEVWHWYAGAPLTLSVVGDGTHRALRLGPAVLADQRPQAVVPAGAWQSARSEGAWTLCGCTVSPGFNFADFEMAAPDWRPEEAR
ncbi:MAG: cupin domain-containing protein [Myxococcales bacterium]|nr:cupin domain-containing protein [Myxococcales bacterium]